jgi:hypothetical protein
MDSIPIISSWGDSDSTMSDYRLDDQVLSPTQPPVQWVLGVHFRGYSTAWNDADHSPPSNAEVKNEYELAILLSPLAPAWRSGSD